MSLLDLLPAYLGRQRWFAGDAARSVSVVEEADIAHGLRWMIVDADGAHYQLVLALRHDEVAPEFLHGHDSQVVGFVDSWLAYDAMLDPATAKALLAHVAPGEEAQHVRPMGAEQSNSSVVFDDRLVLKLFRRLHEGANPDVEVTEALARQGFENVAAPIATWFQGNRHLAVVQPYLAGGSEGWALALTSLRDLYASGCEDPADCGGDFAAEATRLGDVTGRLHVALAAAFGTRPGDAAGWAGGIRRQLERVTPGDVDRDAAEAFLKRLEAVAEAGPAIRVHGDYHLGQVLRTDNGWFVLDFEGEPARPLAERRQMSSPFKDVAGMARSFQYAAAVALADRDEGEQSSLAPLAEAWEARNRRAFLEGYLAASGIDELLPADDESRDVLLAAFELDKAVYELLYERAHRPDWVRIPSLAVRRLLAGI